MSEQPAPAADVSARLTGRGAGACALVWVADEDDPLDAGRIVVGESGIARPGFDPARLTLQEVTRGRAEALSRWLELDDGQRQLAIVSTEQGAVREHTPGELAAHLTRDADTDQDRLTDLLAGWLHRRKSGTPSGWAAATTAWAVHLRALAGHPPPAVLTRAAQLAGEDDATLEELLTHTRPGPAALFARLERPGRPRAELIENWHAVAALAAAVPVLHQVADRLLDRIALRDAHAQHLRAVLEPDLTDHRRDRAAHASLPPATAPAPALDRQRAAHLAQARPLVRAYTAAAHTGREQQAQQILDAFPPPARLLRPTGPATAWRQASPTARHALAALPARRQALTGQDSLDDFFADPELLHAQITYLAVREAQLHLEHDALGRLTTPTPAAPGLPDNPLQTATGLTLRRLAEAFGSPERARELLDGRIAYLQQPAHRAEETATELALLHRARTALETQLTGTASLPLDGNTIARRVQEAMANSRTDPARRPPSPAERARRTPPPAPQPGTPQTQTTTLPGHAPGPRP
ncbi:hypothetical protein DKG34_39545 [Streptomyces sp. NWU49]|uniref:hypothetical protein n=1 Tax=Streptomyces sp. NWU49 TaxID=2201153 RepID=UPI000D67536D|nr:hypothetical protein [Streptomyces sp. NWU49]PWJ02268.1 hypothetical protein DKG34_39545 [Streptomyces sp. NWU49]